MVDDRGMIQTNNLIGDCNLFQLTVSLRYPLDRFISKEDKVYDIIEVDGALNCFDTDFRSCIECFV